MSIATISRIGSTSLETTLELAGQVGRKMRGGEVIELISDLGGGKTTFVRGLARGMGSHDAVRSPSFTIGNQYRAGQLTLYHFDFYRLLEPGIMRNELAEYLADPKAIIVIEWGKIVEDVLPPERLTVSFKALSADRRELTFSCPPKLDYLMPEDK